MNDQITRTIPQHRLQAFRRVVDALDDLTNDEKRRVLGAALALVPVPTEPRKPLTAPPLAPIQRAERVARFGKRPGARHCLICASTAHDRRTCPELKKRGLEAVPGARTSA